MNYSRIASILRINILKSIITNFRHFGIKGLLKMPIIIHYGSSIKGPKNSIIFTKPLQFNMLLLKYRNRIFIENDGHIIVNGTKACFNVKNDVYIFSGATFELGHNFLANGRAEFNCRKRIKFGNDCLISVNTMFLDTDFHTIYNQNKEVINQDKEIIIGDRVWIGCNVTILKGTVIGNDIVIGAGSVLTGKYLEDNSIYAGNNPVAKIKSGISWEI